jgi:hypothetical protein
MLERNSDVEATEESYLHDQETYAKIPDNDLLPQKQFKKGS